MTSEKVPKFNFSTCLVSLKAQKMAKVVVSRLLPSPEHVTWFLSGKFWSVTKEGDTTKIRPPIGIRIRPFSTSKILPFSDFQFIKSVWDSAFFTQQNDIFLFFKYFFYQWWYFVQGVGSFCRVLYLFATYLIFLPHFWELKVAERSNPL